SSFRVNRSCQTYTRSRIVSISSSDTLAIDKEAISCAVHSLIRTPPSCLVYVSSHEHPNEPMSQPQTRPHCHLPAHPNQTHQHYQSSASSRPSLGRQDLLVQNGPTRHHE